MTETMKKFKRPFKRWMGVSAWLVVDDKLRLICDTGNSTNSASEEYAAMIADALNFYYAKKGEKEMTPSEEKTAEERAKARLQEIAENAEDYPAKQWIYADELHKAIHEAESLRLTNQRLEAEVERMGVELSGTKNGMMRVAKEFGIEVPEQLFALAQNNEETLTDILIRHIQSCLRNLESQKG